MIRTWRTPLVLALALALAGLFWIGCEDDEGSRGGHKEDDDDAGDDDTGDDDAGDDDTGDDDAGDDDTGDDDTGDDDAGDDDDDDLAWNSLTTAGDRPGPLGFIEAVTSAGAGRMIFYGGVSNPYPTFADEVVTLDYATESFGRIAATGDLPPALYGPAIGWDPAEGRFYLYGGVTETKGASAELYVLDEAAATWTLAGDGMGTIGARELPSGAWDGGRFLVFGGYDPDTKALLGDTWEIAWNGTPGAAVFTLMAATGPDPRSNAATCLDIGNGRWYLFGGAGPLAVFGDLWMMWLVSDDVWETVETTGAAPAAVHSARCFCDEARDRLILFGGYDENGDEHDEIWVLDLSADPPNWTTISQQGDITPRYAGAMAYDPAGDRLIYFGGVRFDLTPDPTFTFYDSTYEMLF